MMIGDHWGESTMPTTRLTPAAAKRRRAGFDAGL